MPTSEEEALKVFQAIAKEMEVSGKVTLVYYREDYGDYQTIIDNKFHCEIREKLLNDYIKTKNPDLKREIFFQLSHPAEFEDWQLEEMGLSQEGEDGRISVDNKDEYDFLE